MILKRYFATVLISLLSCVVSAVASAKEDIALLDQVAVLVYAQSEAGTQYVANARNRLEVILGDNGITVLDQNTADELKNVWNKLEDPGFIITAEDFVDNAGKYDVDGILAIYLTVDSARGLANSFTATAHADLRFVAANAKVEPVTTASMGVRGNPASDGLTQEAASVNAVQRAIDNAALQVGLDVSMLR